MLVHGGPYTQSNAFLRVKPSTHSWRSEHARVRPGGDEAEDQLDGPPRRVVPHQLAAGQTHRTHDLAAPTKRNTPRVRGWELKRDFHGS